MPLFRRKEKPPVELNQFIHGATAPAGVHCDEDGRSYVVTIHNQRAYLESGDWVAPEGDGIHYYPIKDRVRKENFDEEGT